MSKPIRIEGIPQVLVNNQKILSAVKARTQQILAKAALDTEERAKERVPVAFGRLKTSIHTEQSGPFTVDVVAEEEYATPVEFGASAHFPPLDPLKLWAQRVIGDEDAAYPIARKIAAHGTEEQPYMRPSFEEVAPAARSELDKLARGVSGK
ncbi:MAG: HK97 gp10 family phage protein [Actinomycetota bacterium]